MRKLACLFFPEEGVVNDGMDIRAENIGALEAGVGLAPEQAHAKAICMQTDNASQPPRVGRQRDLRQVDHNGALQNMRLQLMRALRKHALNYLDQLWMLACW